MSNILLRASLLATVLLLTACGTPPAKTDYAAFKASKPRSILVLPPLNNSQDVKASDSVLSVTTFPLAEAGYYVIPVALMKEAFRQNGVTTPHDAQEVTPGKLREIFGADSGLYITISEYGANYQIVDSEVAVRVTAKLVDLRSGQTIFTSSASASSAEKGRNSSNDLISLLIVAAVKQIANSVTDSSHEVADIAIQRLLHSGQPNGLLYGPYSPKYGKD